MKQPYDYDKPRPKKRFRIGQRVKCIRGDGKFGAVKGKIYTIKSYVEGVWLKNFHPEPWWLTFKEIYNPHYESSFVNEFEEVPLTIWEEFKLLFSKL